MNPIEAWQKANFTHDLCNYIRFRLSALGKAGRPSVEIRDHHECHDQGNSYVMEYAPYGILPDYGYR